MYERMKGLWTQCRLCKMFKYENTASEPRLREGNKADFSNNNFPGSSQTEQNLLTVKEI